MDKSGDSNSGGNTSSSRDHQYLKQVNKLSHKISKPSSTCNPVINKPNAFDPTPPQQPPVYNINKNDFRLLVQQLTGSPPPSTPSPPIQPPKPPSSRLQRIRPPPLAHLSHRPPPLLSCAAPPVPPPHPTVAFSSTSPVRHNNLIQRPAAPLSPLPPFPTVHAAAESPVSAYMRYLHNSISAADPNSKTPQFWGFSPLAPLASPRWNKSTDTSQQQGVMALPSSQQQMPETQSQPQLQPQAQFPFPSSPLPFDCLNSPRSPYPLLSPSLLFSPTYGQLSFPLSPTVPVPSPLWRGI